MAKENSLKANKNAGQAAEELNEQQLKEKIEKAKQDRLKKFLEAVQKLQEEYKCGFAPALGKQPVQITIQGQPLSVVAIPL